MDQEDNHLLIWNEIVILIFEFCLSYCYSSQIMSIANAYLLIRRCIIKYEDRGSIKLDSSHFNTF